MALPLEPADDTVIWRYTDLARFVMLLDERWLWFSKLTALHRGDPYEGYAVAENTEDPVPLLKSKTITLSPGQTLHSIAGFYASRDVNEAAELVYVNSWCMGAESIGMWDLYGAQGTGVAVKSTVGQYKKAIGKDPRSEQRRYGCVRYVESLESCPDQKFDFTCSAVPASGNLWQLLLKLSFTKRSAYEHEREWRAAVYQDRRPDPGVHMPTDLDALITSVVVGPRADSVALDAVAAVMKMYSLEKPLQRSKVLTRG